MAWLFAGPALMAAEPASRAADGRVAMTFALRSLAGEAAKPPADRPAQSVTIRGYPVTQGAPAAAREDTTVEAEVVLADGATIVLPAGAFVLALEALGYWAQPIAVEAVSGKTTQIEFEIYPTGILTGTFGGVSAEAAPRALELWFEPSRAGAPPIGGDAGIGGSTTCSVGGLTWSCEVPRGRLDLRLTVPGFADSFFWNVEVLPEPRPLGRIDLTEGASLFGWVVSASAEAVEGASVELSAPDAEMASPDRVSLHHRRRTTDAHGFFHFAGIPPGGHVLTASKGAARSEPRVALVSGVGGHAISEPILLYEPATLDIYVDPALAPGDTPWQVDLTPAWTRSLVDAVENQTLSDGGQVSVAGLAHGSYGLTLKDQTGSTWWAGIVDVSSSTPPQVIELEIVRVTGHVKLGDEPLAARIDLSRDRKGRARFQSDEHGHFEATLPEPDTYSLLVEADEPLVSYSLPQVKIDPNEPPLEITIPSSLVAGSVVDENGEPQPAAILTLESGGSFVQRILDDGDFEIRGVSPGPLILSAQAMGPGAPLQSQPLHHQLADGERLLGVQLVVRPFRPLVVSVVGPTSLGVPGATVAIDWEGSPPVGPRVADGAGRLQTMLDARVRSLAVTAAAPGLAYRIFSTPVPEAPELTVPLSSEAGTLSVSLPAPGAPGAVPPVALLLHNGGAIPVRSLEWWARAHRGGQTEDGLLRIPMMEPGTYELCFTPYLERWSLLAGARPPDSRCAAGYLGSNGELALSFQQRDDASQ